VVNSAIYSITSYKFLYQTIVLLTLWRPAAFRAFRKKTPKRTWLCTGISPVRYALQTR